MRRTAAEKTLRNAAEQEAGKRVAVCSETLDPCGRYIERIQTRFAQGTISTLAAALAYRGVCESFATNIRGDIDRIHGIWQVLAQIVGYSAAKLIWNLKGPSLHLRCPARICTYRIEAVNRGPNPAPLHIPESLVP